MAEQLSGVTIVIFIGCGVLTFFILFIFAKRQIMRFALRSRRGPHVPIGHGAKKVRNYGVGKLRSIKGNLKIDNFRFQSLKRELDRMIEVIPRVIHEPHLINNNDPRYILQPGTELPPHYFRLKAVDDVKSLGNYKFVDLVSVVTGIFTFVCVYTFNNI